MVLARWVLPALVLSASGCVGVSTRATATFSPSAASPARVPMAPEWDSDLVAVPVTVNGVAATALLDTGAEWTAIDEAFARRLGLPLGARDSASGVAGSARGRRAPGVRVSVGDLGLAGIEAFVFDLSPMERVTGRKIPVVLGADAFRAAVVEVDPAAHVVVFHDPARFAPPAGALRLPLARVGDSRAVEVAIEGRSPVRLLLDLGSAGTVLLLPAYWRAHLPLEGRPTSTTAGTGIGGTREEATCTVGSLEIAGVSLANVPVDLETDRPTRLPRGVFGLLGWAVLRRFHFFVDYPHDAVWLVPDAAAMARPFAQDRMGLTLVKDQDSLRVLHVAAGSPAEAAGFRIDDRILAIDGRPAAEWATHDAQALNAAAAGRVLVFTMKDGSRRSVTLRSYLTRPPG